MTRLVWIASVFSASLLMFAAPGAAQEPAVPFHGHVRIANDDLRAVMTAALRVSPTLQSIARRIESSDVIVYIDLHRLATPGVAAQSQFVNVSAGRRYVRVIIDSRFSGALLVGLLGHELQHVVEIAGEPSVVDAPSLARFYRRVGFRSPAGGNNRFESAAAIATGRRVMQDAADHEREMHAVVLRVQAAQRPEQRSERIGLP